MKKWSRKAREAECIKRFGSPLCQYDGKCEKGGQVLIEMYFDDLTPMQPYWFCEEHDKIVTAHMAAVGSSMREGGTLPTMHKG